MQTASPRRDATEVTLSAEIRNAGGLVRPFTRHPKALAQCHRLPLQACARAVLALLLTTADADGVSWVSPREMTRRIPRSGRVRFYSLPQVLRALRQLRDAALVVWDSVPAMGRFPRHVDGVAVARAGRFTVSGGRVFRVLVDVLRNLAIPKTNGAGTALARAIIGDQGTPIIHDPPSDRSPSEIRKKDPAAPRHGLPVDVPSQAPALASPPRRDQARAVAARPLGRPAPEKKVGETPAAAEASPRPSPAPSPARGQERLGSTPEARPSPAPPAVSVERQRADFDALFRRNRGANAPTPEAAPVGPPDDENAS